MHFSLLLIDLSVRVRGLLMTGSLTISLQLVIGYQFSLFVFFWWIILHFGNKLSLSVVYVPVTVMKQKFLFFGSLLSQKHSMENEIIYFLFYLIGDFRNLILTVWFHGVCWYCLPMCEMLAHLYFLFFNLLDLLENMFTHSSIQGN